MKIAFLSNFTIDFVVKEFSKKLKDILVESETYVSGYNQYPQEILGENNSFYNFNPELVFFSIDLEYLINDIIDHQFDNSEKGILTDIENRFQQFLNLVSKLRAKLSKAQIFIDNFYLSTDYFFKTLEGNSPFSLRSVPAKLNLQLEEYATRNNGIRIIDISSLFQKYGEKELVDPRLNYIAKSKFSRSGTEKLSKLYLSHVKAYKGLRKKVIVLDLDNTLWGGILGEDDVENIILSNDGPGKAFYDFQRELLKLYKQGILLAICSKNTEETALDAIKNHPYMVLRPNHFAAIKINWENKAQNIKSIAAELNLGIDSFVLIDDSPFERGLIKDQLPEVETPELPDDPMYFVEFLKGLDFFNFRSLTEDDLNRNKNYEVEKLRKKHGEIFTDTTSYLKSLQMQVDIRRMDDFSFPRVVQLIQKTNQFNLTSRRYSESEIKEFAGDSHYQILQMNVKDRFGDYGIVAVSILTFYDSKLYIDSFLMSCRVLGRELETVLLSYITKLAEGKNIQYIEGEIIPTAKNEPCRKLYAKNGFREIKNNYWELNLMQNKIKVPEFIELL